MSSQSIDLLSYLRDNQLIKSSTIDSLIKYGFDSNETLIALDFNKDLQQLQDISFGQKSILRQVLNEYKSLIENDCQTNDNCIKSGLILKKIKTLLINKQLLVNKHLDNTIHTLEKQLIEKENLIKYYKNELKINETIVYKLEINLKQLQNQLSNEKQINRHLNNKLKNQISLSKVLISNENKHFISNEIPVNQLKNELIDNQINSQSNSSDIEEENEIFIEQNTDSVKNSVLISVIGQSSDQNLISSPIDSHFNQNSFDKGINDSENVTKTSDTIDIETNENLNSVCNQDYSDKENELLFDNSDEEFDHFSEEGFDEDLNINTLNENDFHETELISIDKSEQLLVKELVLNTENDNNEQNLNFSPKQSFEEVLEKSRENISDEILCQNVLSVSETVNNENQTIVNESIVEVSTNNTSSLITQVMPETDGIKDTEIPVKQSEHISDAVPNLSLTTVEFTDDEKLSENVINSIKSIINARNDRKSKQNLKTMTTIESIDDNSSDNTVKVTENDNESEVSESETAMITDDSLPTLELLSQTASKEYNRMSSEKMEDLNNISDPISSSGEKIDNNQQLLKSISQISDSSNSVFSCFSDVSYTDSDSISSSPEPNNRDVQQIDDIINNNSFRIKSSRKAKSEAFTRISVINKSDSNIKCSHTVVSQPTINDSKESKPKKVSLFYQYKCRTNGCNLSISKLEDMQKHIHLTHGKGLIAVDSIEERNKILELVDEVVVNKKQMNSFIVYENQINRNGEKPFRCDFNCCNKSFNVWQALHKHQRDVHFRKKTLKCSFNGCDKTFGINYELKRHIIRHTTVRSFKCEFSGCEKSFYTSYERFRHNKAVHVSQKPIQCSFSDCDKRFEFKYQMNRHYNRIHSKTSFIS